MNIRDITPSLRVVESAARTHRRGSVSGATLHYNGPPLAFVPNAAREEAFIRDVDTAYHTKNLGADSLQYHFAVLSSGEVLKTRDAALIAWHCGNPTGNSTSLAVHLPLGVGQAPTEVQWAATERLFDYLGGLYHFARSAVVAHCEWERGSGGAVPRPQYAPRPKQSQCPGSILHGYLARYRGGDARPETHINGRIRWRCPVREQPSAASRVVRYALPNAAVEGVVVEGVAFNNEPRWVRLADGYTWWGNIQEVRG